jgi:hypothetical protein
MMWEADRGPLDALQSVAAVLAYAAATDGLEIVEELLGEVDLSRETLMVAASTLAGVGLRELAKVIRRAARNAKPTPIDELPFDQRVAARWRVGGGQSGARDVDGGAEHPRRG